MCKTIIFWTTEYLNYFSLIFWGIKLFLKKYNVESKRKEWIENLIISVVSVPLVIICVINYEMVSYSNFISYLIIFYMYFFILIYTKGKIKKIFILVAIYVNGTSLIDLLIVAIVLEINRMSRYANWDLIHLGMERSIFLIILCIFYYIIFRVFYERRLLEYLYENIIYRWIIYLYSFIGIVCFFQAYRFGYSEHLIQFWTFYLVCLFIVCGVFMFYMIRIKGEEKNRLLTMRNNLLESNYQALHKAYNENRMLSHDFKNHMLAVRQLIQENQNKEALEYIVTYINRSLTINRRVESGCNIVDIIVNSKIAEAEEKKIEFTYDIGQLGSINIQDIDMCALLANLLDNAIEACERLESKGRWIYLKIKREKHMLIIWIENSIIDDKKQKEKFFQTSKKDKIIHGLGIKSVNNVVQKYDGYKEYEIEKNIFRMYISLPLE